MKKKYEKDSAHFLQIRQIEMLRYLHWASVVNCTKFLHEALGLFGKDVLSVLFSHHIVLDQILSVLVRY